MVSPTAFDQRKVDYVKHDFAGSLAQLAEAAGIALDGHGELCRVMASNAGHLLAFGLPSRERGEAVVRELDSTLFHTGWGVRTLAASQARFNPMSYHNGSVWPHDTALAAAGMARYGERAAVALLLGELYARGAFAGATPAQAFHMIRRQLRMTTRKPLVVMTPKSLLRHKRCVSDLSELAEGSTFHRILWDDAEHESSELKLVRDDKIRRVVLYSGKVYYDLYEEREKREIDDIYLMRIEQLYPFPHDPLVVRLKRMSGLKRVVWAQLPARREALRQRGLLVLACWPIPRWCPRSSRPASSTLRRAWPTRRPRT